MVGAFVILFDPIFQGLAISLMGGTIASTVLTLLVVPSGYRILEDLGMLGKQEDNDFAYATPAELASQSDAPDHA